MSVLRTALRPALTPALGSARRGASRYFTTFDNVAQSYVALSSQIQLVDQYEIECDFYVPNNTVERALFGNSANIAYLSLLANGAIRFRGDDEVVKDTAASTYQGGLLNKLIVKKTATNIIMILNGITVFNDISSANFLFEYIGRYSASAFFLDGIVSNFKVWSGGDRAAGSLVLEMPIDKKYTPTNNIVSNTASTLGANAIPSFQAPYVTANSPVVIATENRLEISAAENTSGYPYVSYDILEANKTYLVTVTCDLRQTSNAAFVVVKDGPVDVSERIRFNSEGTVSTKTVVLKTNSNPLLMFYLDQTIESMELYAPVIFTDVTVQLIEDGKPYGTFVNVAAGDSKYYQQRADGDFVDLQGNVLEVAY